MKEFCMKNSIKLFWIAALIAVIGFTMTACDDGSGNNDEDTKAGPSWKAIADNKFGDSGVNGIAYGNNKFVAVGRDGKMAYSADGVTWNAITSSGLSYPYSIQSIAYGNGKWVAGNLVGQVAYSTDGVSWIWTETGDIPGFGMGSIHSIAYGDGKFVAAIINGNMAYLSDN
jgi:hypothetical protein